MASLQWLHTDPRGIQAAADAGLARARSGEWDSSEAARADLRGLLIASLAAAANVGPSPVHVTDGAARIAVDRATRSDSELAQRALLQGVYALCACGRKRASIPSPPITSVVTAGGVAGQSRPDAGSPIVIGAGAAAVFGAAAIVVTGIVAGAVYLTLSQQVEVEALRIATDAKVREHAVVLASTTDLISAHAQREQEAGASLPWSTEELNQLDHLRTTSREITAREVKAPVLTTVPDVRATSQAAAAAVSKVAGGVSDAVILGVVGVLAVELMT